MPASLRDWLPEDHFAWFVLEAVEQLDLSAFHAAYRDDGWGRQAYDPAMMLALLLYAYCEGERSSRRIERRCREDIAFRVLSANQQPDHATICRFRQRHEPALAGLFVEAPRLCAEAGLVRAGVVALDGTKLRANASRERNRTQAQLEAEVERMLAEAEQVDAGRERGDAARPSAVRTAPLDDRTGLRRCQREPRHPPLPAPRLRRLRQRMAVDRRHAQLAQALPPHSDPRRAGAPGPPLTQTAHPASPRPLVQPGPTPPRPLPMSTSPREPTTPLRLTATPGRPQTLCNRLS